MKYTIKHLRAEFGTDKKCLEFMFQARYGKKPVCPQCQKKDRFYLVESRKRFDCSCGYTISPLSGTIFHKSSTPLTLWFHAMFLFASSKNGVAAKELERQLGVTYKTCHRMKKLIQSIYDMQTMQNKPDGQGKRIVFKRMLQAVAQVKSPKTLQLPTRGIRDTTLYTVAGDEAKVLQQERQTLP